MAETAEKAQEEVAVAVAAKEATETKAAPAAEEVEVEVQAENGANSALTKLEANIIRQVEYYFSDSNLTRDKFLLGEIAKDEEGWVALETLVTFNRLATLSKDESVIVDALMKSDEGLLEISEDHKKVRRHPERPIPEFTDERRKELMTRTVFAKGFSLETTMAEIVDFFANYDKVVHVIMRKYLDKAAKVYKFKGSVFVTFETIDQAKAFIELDKVEFGDRELLRKWQDQYILEKQEERKAKSNKKEKKQKQKEEEEKIELPAGAVFFFEGVAEDVTREILREALEKVDGELEIAYIDFSKGAKDGYIRLQGENTAAKFLDKTTNKKLKLDGGAEIALRILTEEEEKAYLEKAAEQMRNRRSNFNQKHKKNNRHHHHGHGHGHGHGKKRRSGNDVEVPDKRQKVDE